MEKLISYILMEMAKGKTRGQVAGGVHTASRGEVVMNTTLNLISELETRKHWLFEDYATNGKRQAIKD